MSTGTKDHSHTNEPSLLEFAQLVVFKAVDTGDKAFTDKVEEIVFKVFRDLKEA